LPGLCSSTLQCGRAQQHAGHHFDGEGECSIIAPLGEGECSIIAPLGDGDEAPNPATPRS
jgi:hypothetical protein